MQDDHQTTHFGYQQVPVEEKVDRVAAVFSSVAEDYDLMNDLMSFGLHRAWKHFAINLLNVRPDHRLLDLAGGTGDLTARIHAELGPKGQVVLADINREMLEVGRRRFLDQGIIKNLEFVQANAENLPFEDNSFDRIIIGFGLRNVTDKQAALSSMYRTLKPGGYLLVLEFSQPTTAILKKFYDLYSFSLLPKLGKWVAKDEASYQYLAESIRMHPNQAVLKEMLEAAGFEDCDFHNLTGGVVAVHRGYKY